MLIRELAPDEAPLVAWLYRDAPEYWRLAEGGCKPDRQAAEFFTDAPPGCDPGQSHRLGLFLPASAIPDDSSAPDASPLPHGEVRGLGGAGQSLRLSGVAELSFGFPTPADAYLGLMLLGPWAQGRGHGRAFLAHVETLARRRAAPKLYLAVLDANPRGRAFWLREGFLPTGFRGQDRATGHWLERLGKALLP
jgi:GNAT superfamily N-acetyltransferase